jgi:hypothetical protein
VALEILDFVEFVRGKTISALTNGPTAVAAASHWPKILLNRLLLGSKSPPTCLGMEGKNALAF